MPYNQVSMQNEISGLLDHLDTQSPTNVACVCGCDVTANQPSVVVCARCHSILHQQPNWCLDGLAEKERCGPAASPLYASVANACQAPPMMLEMDSRDRAMLDASRRIRCMQQTQGNGISAAVASVAERMFRTVLESESLKGSRREGLLEGVMFAAARSCGCARTVSEIATMFNNDHTKVLGGIRRVLEVIDQRGFRVSPRDFTRRFVMRIPAASEPGTTMWHLVDQYVLCLEQTDRYEDEAPHVVAAAAISLAWEHTGRTGGDALAALASGVSRSTVRKCVKKLGPERLQTVTLVTERLAGAQIAWTSGRERKRVASERNNLR